MGIPKRRFSIGNRHEFFLIWRSKQEKKKSSLKEGLHQSAICLLPYRQYRLWFFFWETADIVALDVCVLSSSMAEATFNAI